jgi:RimJ/RimL family protein N-acetyltransferase
VTLDSLFSTVLSSDRIVIKPYDESRDFDHIAVMFSDPRVTAPIGIPNPNPFLENLREAKRERALLHDAADWTIYAHHPETNADTFIGEVGIAYLEPYTRVTELFLATTPDNPHQGYGREAVSLLMDHIFRNDPLITIRMQTLSSNIPALSMCAKLGFRITGERYMEPDPGRGFIGGIALILDCRISDYKKYQQ